MAVDSFPIYDTLVNSVFGSVGIALVGLFLVLVLIMFLCRVSKSFMIFWLFFYVMVMLTMYYGGPAIAVFFIGIAIYLGISILKFVSGMSR